MQGRWLHTGDQLGVEVWGRQVDTVHIVDVGSDVGLPGDYNSIIISSRHQVHSHPHVSWTGPPGCPARLAE